MKIVKDDEIVSSTCYVYFANCETGFVKIGISKNPKDRLKQVSSRHHIPITEYFLVEGDGELESQFHKIYKDQRVYAEWFIIDFEDAKKFVMSYEFKSKINKIVKQNDVKPIELAISKQLKMENSIESEIVSQFIHSSSLVTEMINGRIEMVPEIIEELLKVTIAYNNFIYDTKIKTGDEYELITGNINMVSQLARIGYVFNPDYTRGKDDKQIYQMVKEWIDNGISK